MDSEELQEPIEEKKAYHEATDLQSIHNPITTEYKREQTETTSDVVHGNIVDKEEDLVKEETEVPSKLGISVAPNQIITEKLEDFKNSTVNLVGDLKEKEVLKHEEASTSLEELATQEEQAENVNGETESELHSSQFTEELLPEVVLKGDEIHASPTPLFTEEVQEERDIEEVRKEDAHQNQISKIDETEKDASQSNSGVALSEQDCQKEDESPSSMTLLVEEEVLEEAKGKQNVAEEVQKEEIHQIETAQENSAQEKECPEETEDQSRDVSEVVTSEETIPAEASQENRTRDMISEEVEQTEGTTAEVDETSQTDNVENINDKNSTSYDQPMTNEETGKSIEGSEHMSEEVKGTVVHVSATPFISEEALENKDIKEDAEEEAHENQISKEDEADKDASQSTTIVDLSQRDYQNETENATENASRNPKEDLTKEEGLTRVESPSSVTPPVSEEVSEEAKEKNDVVGEVQKEQIHLNEAAEEILAEEKKCPAEVQNRDVSEVVISEETMPEEASQEKETPEKILEEVEQTEDTVATDEKDETNQNSGENAPYKDSTSSHQSLANEEAGKCDEGSEHISEEPSFETTTTRDVTPEIEIKNAETKAPTSETDDRDIEKFEVEAKSSEEVKPSESSDAPLKIKEETLNDSEEKKSEEDDKLKQHEETEDKQEVNSCFETEEQLDESKASPSEEEVSARRDTVEAEPIKETEEDEKNITQNEITLDSKETLNSEEVLHCDEKTGEAKELHIAGEHDAKDGFNEAEPGEGNGEDDEVDKRNIEEISEPTESSNNTKTSIDAEILRKDRELQSVDAASAQLTKTQEALQEAPIEGTTLSKTEKENTGYQIPKEVKQTEDTVAMGEIDETNQNDCGENAPDKDSISSHQFLANEEAGKCDEGSEHISEEPNLETTTTRDATPEIEIKNAEIKAPTSETDDRDIEKFEDEAKSSEEVKPSKSSDAPLKIKDEALNDCGEEKSEEENKLKEHKQTDDKQEVNSCFETREQLEESKASPSEEELSAERDTIEIEPIKKPEDENKVTQNEITSDSKETLNNEDVAHYDEKTEEVVHIAGEHNAKHGFHGDELGQNGEGDEVDKRNIKEISEPAEPSNNTQASTDAEISREDLESEIDKAVSAQLTKSEEPLQETPSEDITPSEMERENTGYKEQLVMEKADEQDGLQFAPNDNEIESEKLEVGNASGRGEEKVSEVLQNDDELDMKVKPEDEAEAETLKNEEITQIIEAVEEPCIAPIKEELSETESLVEHKETSNEASISAIQQDQPSQESDAKSTEANQATDDVSVEESSKANDTLISNVEQVVVRSIAEEEGATTQEENIVAEPPNEEAEGAENLEESTEKQVEEIPQITKPSEITEVELGQSETVGPEIEHFKVISDEKCGEESKLADPDAKSAEMENIKDELVEQKEVSIEASITREPQVDQTEIIIEQDQQSNELDVKQTEPNQATEEISAEENSDADATLTSSVEQIGVGSTGKEESVILEEENVVLETPKEKAEGREEKTEETNDKHIDEEISQITNPSEVTEVELGQSETVGPDTEHFNVVSNEFGEESKLTDPDAKSAEMENMKDELVEQKEVSIEASITREPQIDQREIIIEQDPQSQESDVKLTEPNQATEEISAEENSDADATLSSSVEQFGERSTGKEESVISQEENVVLETPKEEAEAREEKIEETNEKHIEEEVPQNVHPSEISEEQFVQSEAVGPEAEQLEIVSNEKLGDESELAETDVKSAQMEIKSDQLVEEKLIADFSSSVEDISERSVESEVLLRSTNERVQGEKIDAEMPDEEIGRGIEAGEEPCDKHVEGEIRRTVDPENSNAIEESKAVLNDEEVDHQKFGTEIESPEPEKVTEDLASVEEKSDATATLAPGEGEVIEKESVGVPQSTSESVIIPEEKVSREVETNEEPSDKHILGEISKIANPEEIGTEVESTELEKATEESVLVMEKLDATPNLVPGEGEIEETEIASKEISVAPQSTIETVAIPEERVSQGIETNEEPNDKHIIGELLEKDITIDNLEAPEEIDHVQEDKIEIGQITASAVEEPDSKNVGTEMESAFLEKTDREIDVKANIEESNVTSVVEEEGSVISQSAEKSVTVHGVDLAHAEKSELSGEKTPSDVPVETTDPVSTETEELKVKEDALYQTIKENKETIVEMEAKEGQQTKEGEQAETKTQEEISEVEKILGEKEILNVAFEEPVSGENDRDTDKKGVEENREFAADQEAERETEIKESEGSEHRDFASIVSSFLINKVLSEENQKTDDDTKQNDDALFIAKEIDGETIQQQIRTNEKEETETAHEEISYATSSREEENPVIQEQEKEENGVEIGDKNGEEGAEQDYLPVSRFLMDKIMQQDENKIPEKEEKVLEETDKQLVADGGIQEEENIKVENNNVVVAPQQKGDTTSLTEVARDLEKGENLIEKVDETLVADGGISKEEKIEENGSVAAAPKQEGETVLSPIEVARNFEEEKLTKEKEPVEEKNETLVSDVRAFEKEDENIEENNEAVVSNEGISIVKKVEEENADAVAIPKQGGEATSDPVDAVRDFEEEKPIEQEDRTLDLSHDRISIVENTEGENSEVAGCEQKGETTSYILEEVKDLENREQSKDLVSVSETSNSEKLIEERSTVVIPKEEELKNDVVVGETAPNYAKNLEENYVLVEYEIDQFEEPKEILETEKIAKETSDVALSNLEEKKTILSAEIQAAERNPTGEVEVTDRGSKDSSVSYNEIEQRNLPDTAKIVMAEVETKEKILHEPLEKLGDLDNLKEVVGKETGLTYGEEEVKEVTDTVVETIENKNQENLTEKEVTKEEKKSEEVKEEEQGEEEEEDEEEMHVERETEIIGTDMVAKAATRDTEIKPVQKKSHNILSGVGSKVKHSLAKVKKAITGKSKNVTSSAK